MTFGTFVLYLFLTIVILVVGYYAVCFLIGITSVVVQRSSDAAKAAKFRRGSAKWERVEDGLDDEETGELL